MRHMRAAYLAARATFAGRGPARTHLGFAFFLESSTFVARNPINKSSILVLTRSDFFECFYFLNNTPRRRHRVPTPRRHWRCTPSSRDLHIRAIAASLRISLAGTLSGRRGLLLPCFLGSPFLGLLFGGLQFLSFLLSAVFEFRKSRFAGRYGRRSVFV